MANAFQSDAFQTNAFQETVAVAVADTTIRQDTWPRYRRGAMVWVDEDGTTMELRIDEHGIRHVRVREHGAPRKVLVGLAESLLKKKEIRYGRR